MKKSMVFVALAGGALSAEAPAPRESGLDIPSAQSRDVLVACIEKKMRGNVVKEVPIGDTGLSIQTIKYPN